MFYNNETMHHNGELSHFFMRLDNPCCYGHIPNKKGSFLALYQSKLYYSPKFSSIMPMQYENSTMQLDYIEYAIGIN